MTLPTQYQDIKTKFDYIVAINNDIYNPDTTELFENWYKNKQNYIEWFGGELIHEFGEVEFHVDKEKKNEIIDEFLNQASYVLSIDEYSNFYQFVKANKETFFENLVSNDKLTFGKNIKNGIKLSKAFKYFIENKDQLTTVQQLASKYIQQDKVKGILCASVHPLDFLSASENNYNWRSCHSLDGDFAAGNLSYMGDACTSIWYLKSEGKDTTLPNFGKVRWNDKKWRMFLYLSEDWDVCFLGRQYPFEISGILNYVKEHLPNSDFWLPFINDQLHELKNNKDNSCFYFNHPYIALTTSIWDGPELYKLSDVIQDAKTKLHYNDLLYSSYYTPYYSSMKTGRKTKKQPKIIVGSDVKCINCGERYINSGSRYMLCENCNTAIGHTDGYVQCACCGEYFDPDDMHYLHNGDAVCDRCIESDDIVYCDDCGEYFYRDEMKWSEVYSRFFCEDCFEDIAEEEAKYCKEHGLYEED